MYIGSKLREIRTERSLKQDAMATELGISQSGYAKLERNEHEVNSEKLEYFAAKLGIEPVDLLEPKYTFNTYNNGQAAINLHNYNSLSEKHIATLEKYIEVLQEKIDKLEKQDDEI